MFFPGTFIIEVQYVRAILNSAFCAFWSSTKEDFSQSVEACSLVGFAKSACLYFRYHLVDRNVLVEYCNSLWWHVDVINYV